ncbi:MAG: LuxR C-terminal-related transcriptional regulator [Planctomycetaceae bacterium]
MHDEFWLILKSQPGVGILIIDVDGLVLFCNEQSRQIYYGDNFNPVGMTIEEIEGPEFAAERMPAIRTVVDSGKPVVIRHIRGGRHTEAMIWPMQPVEDRKPRVLAVTRQSLEEVADDRQYQLIDSQLVDLGPLDSLTRRELEVLALIGHGVPQKTVARQLGVAQRTVERYRSDIARKLNINSIADAARIVQVAGLDVEDARLPRLHRWRTNDD